MGISIKGMNVISVFFILIGLICFLVYLGSYSVNNKTLIHYEDTTNIAIIGTVTVCDTVKNSKGVKDFIIERNYFINDSFKVSYTTERMFPICFPIQN